MKVIGIDPGLSGAIAVLENNKVLNALEELDDVQNIFTNVNLKNLQ